MTVAGALVAAGVLLVGQAPSRTGADAAQVRKLIRERGAREALRQLFSDTEAEEALANGIATGRPEWLEIAAELYPVSDAGPAEGLAISVQEALPRNPTGVLGLVRRGILDVKHTCGGYGFGQIEDDRPTDVILGLVDRRLEALAGVADPPLEDQKKACLQELARLRARLEATLPTRSRADDQDDALDEDRVDGPQ